MESHVQSAVEAVQNQVQREGRISQEALVRQVSLLVLRSILRAVNSADATSRLRTTLLQYRIGFFSSTDIFHEKAFLG